MVFQGSKNRISKYLLPIIHDYIEKYDIDTYIELFGGGLNLIDKVQCENKIACDINDELISLLQYAQHFPSLPIAPEDCSFEHYADVRLSRKMNDGRYSKEYIALIGYMASYGGRYFDGGYGRNSKGGKSIYNERLKEFRSQAIRFKDIDIRCCDYRKFDVDKHEGALYYLDPPYKGTKQYLNNFNHEEFYDFCRELSKKNIVLVSEYEMPDDFECIWKMEKKVLQDSTRTKGKSVVEKLFVVKS